MAMTRAVFLDKDGTLIENLPYNADPARIRLADSAGAALRCLRQAGFRLFVVSNQSGIARGLIDEAAMAGVRERITQLMRQDGVVLDGFYYCPHWPHGRVAQFARACDCRKPAPGMLLRAAREHGLTLAGSWMVGDILDDIEAGRRAGCRTVLIENGNETRWQQGPLRRPHWRVRNLCEAAGIITRFMALP
jgi:histidinol-phosphate phosphatase family protein